MPCVESRQRASKSLRIASCWSAGARLRDFFSISERGVDYLIAAQHMPTRRIGGRVLIPVADLRKYARGDDPERIVS